MQTRITEMLGIEIPIVQAPMGWIARSQLASAVSNAGGLGIIETSSGELDNIKAEVAKMRELTDRPFGMNLAQLFIRDPLSMVEFVAENEIGFVTTSAGDPAVLVPRLKELGITVFHVVPTIRGAQKAIDAGVDGLVVEGAEGGEHLGARGRARGVDHGLEMVGDDRVQRPNEEFGLAPIAAVDRPGGQPGSARDLGDACAVIAALGEDLCRGGEQARLGLDRSARCPRSCHDTR